MKKGVQAVKVKLDRYAYAPERAHSTDAGLDLKCPENAVVIIRAGESETIDTGVHIELPKGTAGLLVSKSGLNVRHDILSTGLIDEGYTGEIKVKLYNHGDSDFYVYPGDKISQLVIIPVRYEPVELVEELEETDRGSNGFGSTGR